MAGPDRQFDPVANSALGAVRATNRGLRELENKGLPGLPQRSQAQRTIRNSINSASTISPFNVVAGEGSFPALPGSGNGNGGSASTMLPDGVPSPESALPFEVPQSLQPFTPSAVFENLMGGGGGSMPTPPTPGNGGNGGSGGGNGGSGGGRSGSGSSGSSGRAAPSTR